MSREQQLNASKSHGKNFLQSLFLQVTLFAHVNLGAFLFEVSSHM
jgi:hypothetical protein